MRLSRFCHIVPISSNGVAYYNSLFLRPVFFNQYEHNLIQNYLIHNNCSIDDKIKSSLVDNRIIISSDEEDDKLLADSKAKLLTPYPVIAYLILSEKCNLACKYCFLGNNKDGIIHSQMQPMSFDIAKKSIDYYSFQLKKHPEWFEHEKEIIFYGGEPLLNFGTLKFVVQYVNKLISKHLLPKKMSFSMVTNGLLLNEDSIKYLMSNNIATSISIDGVDASSNNNRVDKLGQEVFEKLIHVLDEVQRFDWHIGLSITLTQKTIDNVNGIFDLIQKYSNITGISFNLLYPSIDFPLSNDYYEKASEFIIRFFLKARKMGIYEERIYRKIDSFVNGELCLSDCAATSGSQITILPDGRVGICHGCIEDKSCFFTSISNKTDLSQHPEMLKWSMISPITKEECYSCIALGICGGGCPVHNMKISNIPLQSSIDEGYCIYAKKVLDFMLRDLYHILVNGEPMDEDDY